MLANSHTFDFNNLTGTHSCQGIPEVLFYVYHRKIIENNRRQPGPEHLYVGFALSSLSSALSEDGRSEEALPLLDEALEILKKSVGDGHRYYAMSLSIKGDAVF